MVLVESRLCVLFVIYCVVLYGLFSLCVFLFSMCLSVLFVLVLCGGGWFVVLR